MNVKIIKPEDTFPVRKEVLRKGIPLPYEFHGDFDINTKHFGYFVDEKLVSIATVLKSSHELFTGKQFQLRGMATLEAYQGKGYGSVLVNEIIKYVKEQSGDVLWFNARIKALHFYEQLGFKTIGELFEIKYVGNHYVMYNNY